MPHDVFISHASKDAPTAQAVLAALEARGVRCWIAPRDITAGREWEPSIMAALAQARAVVLVFSGAANASAHVRREVAAAADAGVPVVPYRVDRAEMEQALRYYLAGVHWLDAVSGPPERNLAALADTVEQLLGSEESREPRPEGRGNPPKRRLGLAATALLAVGVPLLLAAIAIPAVGLIDRLRPQPSALGPAAAAPAPRPSPPSPIDPAEAAPEALVRSLYTRGAALTALPASRLTPALAAAERTRVDDEERPDWRYGRADPPPFEDLTFTTEVATPQMAETRVTWGSFPGRRTVTWTLCRQPDGRWRIADVQADGRSLRQRNALPPPDPLNGC